jgi:hypothetical protein
MPLERIKSGIKPPDAFLNPGESGNNWGHPK